MFRRVLLFLGLTASVLPLPGQPDEAFRISVDVNLVVLHATIRDREGRPVPHLREQDIEVYEDGVRQSVRFFSHEDTPVTVGILVDHSGSIRHKLPGVVAASRSFVRSSHPLDQMFVVNFNEHVTLPQPDTAPFTSRPDELERAITSAPATGRTALYDAILIAVERLRLGSLEKRALIVISDGGDNASAHGLDEVLKTAALSSALIYTIGVFDSDDPDRNPGVLRQLAKATGGEAFFPADRAALAGACQRIAADIRQHYTISYVSSNRSLKSGAYRAVRLIARQDGRKLYTRARAGYITGGGR